MPVMTNAQSLLNYMGLMVITLLSWFTETTLATMIVIPILMVTYGLKIIKALVFHGVFKFVKKFKKSLALYKS